MSKELYEDVLEEEPQDIKDFKDKKYKKWEKRLHSSIGWIEPETHAEFLYERTKGGKIVLNSSPLDEKTHWDVSTGEGGFTCEDQEHAGILSLVLQINERLKKIEERLNDKNKQTRKER